MTINCPSHVKINIIDGASIKTLDSDSEEFTYQARQEVSDDFDDNHEGEDVILSYIGRHLQLTCPSSGVPYHNQKKKMIGEELQSFTCSPRQEARIVR